MSSHVVVMGKYYVTPDKLNRNEVAFTVTLLIRIQSWHNEENDLLHFSNIQRTETKQICFFVATVSSTTITVWAWPSPPPSWGSGPAATKERAVAYTRRPSCCEPRFYSAIWYTLCFDKNSQNIFVITYVKSSPTLVIFGAMMAKTTELHKVHLYFILPNVCLHTTVVLFSKHCNDLIKHIINWNVLGPSTNSLSTSTFHDN